MRRPVSDLGYDRLIIGVDDTFAPMGFLDENNDLAGFDIDLAKAVGEKLGVEVEFQTIDWSMKEQELMQGNVDVLWNGYTITEERKDKGVIFTEPYLDNKQVVCVMADSGITSLADLAGKTVAAQAESSAIEAMAGDAPRCLRRSVLRNLLPMIWQLWIWKPVVPMPLLRTVYF